MHLLCMAAAGPSSSVMAPMLSGYEQDHTETLWDVPDEPLDRPSTPLFQIGTVQYALDAPVASVAAASNRLALCLFQHGDNAPMHIVYLDLDDPARTKRTTLTVPVPTRSAARVGDRTPRIFMDPAATHILLCVDTHTYYWTPSWTRPRLVQRLESVLVTAVAWGPQQSAPPVSLGALPGGRRWAWTPLILLGTARGDLIETIITAPLGDERPDLLDRWARRAGGAHEPMLERYVQHVFSLTDIQPVTGLSWEWNAEHQALVTVATSSRLYEFTGTLLATAWEGQAMLEPLFTAYQTSPLPYVKTELPPGPGCLVAATPPAGLPQAPKRVLSWLCGAGIYTTQVRGLHALEHADLVPCPTSEQPWTLGCTPLHLVLVYGTKVACLCSLDAQLVYEAPLPLEPGERVLGTAMDATTGICWIYTAHALLELVVNNETRDVWRSLLARHEYDGALAFCPNESAKRVVLAQKADALLSAGQAMEAASCYAAAQAPRMEQVILSFLYAHATDALRHYVRLRLDALPRDQPVSQLMLATWLLELYMAAMGEKEEERDTAGVQSLQDEVQAVIRQHGKALHPSTTYQLFQKQGRMDLWLMYAERLHDTRRIVQHWVDAQEWTRALEALSAQSRPELYYDFAAVLMKHDPAHTVQCWQRCDMLDVGRLVPALLQHTIQEDDEQAVDYTLVYLAYAIDVQGSRDKSAHALRLTRLAAHARHRPALLAFVEHASPEGLDLAFALRVCAAAQCQEACVRLYARMEQYENAVQLALSEGNVELACACADLATHDQDLRRDLWLQCAQHVIQARPNMQEAMQFLLRTDVLTVEDILPLFPDFNVIDDLKDEICDTLEGYVTRIDALKDEMDKTTATAASIQNDIRQLCHRVIQVPASQLCMACEQPLLQRQLYVFPCSHGFHADCLTTQVTQNLPPRRLRRLLHLQAELGAMTAQQDAAPTEPSRGKSSSALLGMSLERLRESVRPQAIVDAITASLQGSLASGRKDMAEEAVAKRHAASEAPTAWTHTEALRNEMNAIIAGACPTCMLCVQQLDAPYETADEADNWWI
ncbi:hypothetical protein MNAN1_002237 [Malassezia nana]|uniref:Pep3/Vps18/deep orange domain-containing protein n=1 Tax=Malassezia nana TaxID=180528 RepID=A0AAF0ER15_9BASI|nr:hypothetical protein MNAN1_002237 [Malassezia nana]